MEKVHVMAQVSWTAEERHTGVHCFGAGQHLPGSSTADGTGASMKREIGAKGPENRPSGSKNGVKLAEK